MNPRDLSERIKFTTTGQEPKMEGVGFTFNLL